MAHGTAFFRDVFLIGMRSMTGYFPSGIKFGRVGLFHVAHVSGKFDDGTLHAEAEPKEGNFIFTGITNSVDFPLYTAVAKAAGDDDTVNTGKYFIQIRLSSSRISELIQRMFTLAPMAYPAWDSASATER